MKFNNYTGTGSQEIIFMKKAIKEIKKVLVDALSDITSIFTALLGKQDKFSTVTTDSETGNKTLSSENKVILSNDFEATSSETNADSNNIVNVSMLRSYHDASKQDALTAGTNVTIQDNVISASGGETLRNIIEYTVGADESLSSIVINEDSNGDPIRLKKAKIFIFCPQDSTLQATQNGYFRIKENATAQEQWYGSLIYVSNVADNYVEIEINCNDNYPAIGKYVSETLGTGTHAINESFGINAGSVLSISSFEIITLSLNANYFPENTHIVVKGVDA